MKSLAELASLASLGCPEAPASQCASASCYRLAENVGFLPVVKSELKLREIQRQIFLAHTVIAAHDSALEQRPERFNRIGMHDAAHVFTRAMANYLMRQSEILAAHAEQAIAAVFISGNERNLVGYSLAHETIQGRSIRAFDDLTNHVPLAADCADDRGLPAHASDVLLLVPVAILIFAADASFVYFNNAHELLKVRIVHAGAQAMAHIPSCAVSATSYLPLNLECTNAFLGIENLPENFKPSLERIVRILENRSGNDGKAIPGPAALRALPMPRSACQFINLVVAATRALHAVWPATVLQKLFARAFVRERRHQFTQGHHTMKDSTELSLCQVRHNRPNQGLGGEDGGESER